MLTRESNRSNERQAVESLLGDVDHWAGSAYVEEAEENLRKAKLRFEAASKRSSDQKHPAAGDLLHVNEMLERLDKGPTTQSAPPKAPVAPPPSPTENAPPAQSESNSADAIAL
jgi:hypothetical protein